MDVCGLVFNIRKKWKVLTTTRAHPMHPEQQPLPIPSPRSGHPILGIVTRAFKVDDQIRVVFSEIAVLTIQADGTFSLKDIPLSARFGG